MTEQPPIKFNNGASYERMMGTWSRLVGERFLEWLNPATHGRWLDVGCGSGALTQLIVNRCSPAAVIGIDPAEDQLAFARQRPACETAEFRLGMAEKLVFPHAHFDVAAMAWSSSLSGRRNALSQRWRAS